MIIVAEREPILEARGITVVYPNGVVANVDVNFKVYEGEIVALLGENGAGKSTLVRAVAGIVRPNKGEVYFQGRKVVINNYSEALKLGIYLVSQNPHVFETLTVAEDVGLTLSRAGFKVKLRDVEKLLASASLEYDVKVSPHELGWGLSMGEKQRVEIAKALLLNSKVIMLDEPTTHLTPMETSSLLGMLRRLTGKGKGIVFITHKIGEAMNVADRIVVMRGGRVTGEFNAGSVTRESLLEAMFGAGNVNFEGGVKSPPLKEGDGRATLIDVEDLWVLEHGVPRVKGVTFSVREGEIVGVAGVAGNGQRELFEALIGLRKPARGRVRISGVDVTSLGPGERVKRGLAVIPEEKLGWALVPGLSVKFNVAFALASVNSGLGFLVNWSKVDRIAREVIGLTKVKVAGGDVPVDSLSGGNMQRLIVARELFRKPKIVIAMNPTGGLDYATSVEVRKLIVKASGEGTGFLIISEDLGELLEISDRIIVMSRGSLKGGFGRPFNFDSIAKSMAD